jgi:hypothetical protein
MQTTLYYTVDKELRGAGDGIEETTGFKTICVFEIANDIPKPWFEIEESNHRVSEEAIKEWLDHNGFGDRNYKFVQL